MVDAHVTQARSRMGMVLEVIKERHSSRKPPFGDVLEVVDSMRESGLTDLDIGLAISRLVRVGQLRYALDGIRLVAQ